MQASLRLCKRVYSTDRPPRASLFRLLINNRHAVWVTRWAWNWLQLLCKNTNTHPLLQTMWRLKTSHHNVANVCRLTLFINDIDSINCVYLFCIINKNELLEVNCCLTRCHFFLQSKIPSLPPPALWRQTSAHLLHLHTAQLKAEQGQKTYSTSDAAHMCVIIEQKCVFCLF